MTAFDDIEEYSGGNTSKSQNITQEQDVTLDSVEEYGTPSKPSQTATAVLPAPKQTVANPVQPAVTNAVQSAQPAQQAQQSGWSVPVQVKGNAATVNIPDYNYAREDYIPEGTIEYAMDEFGKELDRGLTGERFLQGYVNRDVPLTGNWFRDNIRPAHWWKDNIRPLHFAADTLGNAARSWYHAFRPEQPEDTERRKRKELADLLAVSNEELANRRNQAISGAMPAAYSERFKVTPEQIQKEKDNLKNEIETLYGENGSYKLGGEDRKRIIEKDAAFKKAHPILGKVRSYLSEPIPETGAGEMAKITAAMPFLAVAPEASLTKLGAIPKIYKGIRGAGKVGKALARPATAAINEAAKLGQQGAWYGFGEGLYKNAKGEDVNLVSNTLGSAAEWGAGGAIFGGAGGVLRRPVKAALNVAGEIMEPKAGESINWLGNTYVSALDKLGIRAATKGGRDLQNFKKLLLNGKGLKNATPEQLEALENFKNMTPKEQWETMQAIKHGDVEGFSLQVKKIASLIEKAKEKNPNIRHQIAKDADALTDEEFFEKYKASKEAFMAAIDPSPDAGIRHYNKYAQKQSGSNVKSFVNVQELETDDLVALLNQSDEELTSKGLIRNQIEEELDNRQKKLWAEADEKVEDPFSDKYLIKHDKPQNPAIKDNAQSKLNPVSDTDMLSQQELDELYTDTWNRLEEEFIKIGYENPIEKLEELIKTTSDEDFVRLFRFTKEEAQHILDAGYKKHGIYKETPSSGKPVQAENPATNTKPQTETPQVETSQNTAPQQPQPAESPASNVKPQGDINTPRPEVTHANEAPASSNAAKPNKTENGKWNINLTEVPDQYLKNYAGMTDSQFQENFNFTREDVINECQRRGLDISAQLQKAKIKNQQERLSGGNKTEAKPKVKAVAAQQEAKSTIVYNGKTRELTSFSNKELKKLKKKGNYYLQTKYGITEKDIERAIKAKKEAVPPKKSTLSPTNYDANISVTKAERAANENYEGYKTEKLEAGTATNADQSAAKQAEHQRVLANSEGKAYSYEHPELTIETNDGQELVDSLAKKGLGAESDSSGNIIIEGGRINVEKVDPRPPKRFDDFKTKMGLREEQRAAFDDMDKAEAKGEAVSRPNEESSLTYQEKEDLYNKVNKFYASLDNDKNYNPREVFDRMYQDIPELVNPKEYTHVPRKASSLIDDMAMKDSGKVDYVPEDEYAKIRERRKLAAQWIEEQAEKDKENLQRGAERGIDTRTWGFKSHDQAAIDIAKELAKEPPVSENSPVYKAQQQQKKLNTEKAKKEAAYKASPKYQTQRQKLIDSKVEKVEKGDYVRELMGKIKDAKQQIVDAQKAKAGKPKAIRALEAAKKATKEFIDNVNKLKEIAGRNVDPLKGLSDTEKKELQNLFKPEHNGVQFDSNVFSIRDTITDVVQNFKNYKETRKAIDSGKKISELIADGGELSNLRDKLSAIGDVIITAMPENIAKKNIKTLGSFSSDGNVIYMNMDAIGNNTVKFGKTLLHEAEHAKQYKEYLRIMKKPRSQWTPQERTHVAKSRLCVRANNRLRNFVNKDNNKEIIVRISDNFDTMNNAEFDRYFKTLTPREQRIYNEYQRLFNEYEKTPFESEARAAGRGQTGGQYNGKGLEQSSGVRPERNDGAGFGNSSPLDKEKTRGGTNDSRNTANAKGNGKHDEFNFYSHEGIGLSKVRRVQKAQEEQAAKAQAEQAERIAARKVTPAETVSEAVKNGKADTPEVKQAIESVKNTPSTTEKLKYAFSDKSLSEAEKRRNLNRQTESLKVKYDIITKEQAENRLKQQTKSPNGTYYHRGYTKSDGSIKYNEEQKVKTGLFGRKTQKGVKDIDHTAGYAQDIEDSVRTNYVDNVITIAKESFAKTAEQAKEAGGQWVPVNENTLANMIYGGKSQGFMDMLSRGEKAIQTGLKGDKENIKYWNDFIKRNNKVDYYLPKSVVNEMIKENTNETIKEFLSREWKLNKSGKTGAKAMLKFIGAASDVITNQFKKQVLTTMSFGLNNRISNQAMLMGQSGSLQEYVKSFFEAGKMDDKKLPVEITSSLLKEILENPNARKVYTGYESFDNFANLLDGHLIDTSTLKTWAGKTAAGTGNLCIGLPNKGFTNVCKLVMDFNEKFETFERKQALSLAISKNKKTMMQKLGQQTITTKEFLEHLPEHPEIRDVIIKSVDDILGNYSTFTKAEKTWLRRIVPFYSWYRTVLRHHVQLFADDPARWYFINTKINQLKNEDLSDTKEYQKGYIPTGIVDKRSGKELIINKAKQIPYGMPQIEELVEEGRGALHPALMSGWEALKGEHNFKGTEITDKTWARVKKYGSDEYTYVNIKTGEERDSLPASVRAKYLLRKNVVDTAAPYLRNRLLDAEGRTQGAIRAAKGRGNLTPDKYYDTGFGGFRKGDYAGKYENGYRNKKGEYITKKKVNTRYAGNDLSENAKLINSLTGLCLQNKQPLNKKEREELIERLRKEEDNKPKIKELLDKWKKIKEGKR